MMHLKFSDQFCIEIDAAKSEKPLCCTCQKPVDWYGRKIEMDRLGCTKADPDIEQSKSYRALYIVRCHGSSGMVSMASLPTWEPFFDPRPEVP